MDRRVTAGAAMLLMATSLGSLATSRAAEPEAETRLRRYFTVPTGTPFEDIPAWIMRRVPRGSPKDQLDTYLSTTGIGRDGLSSCHPSTTHIVCRVEFDPHTWGLVKTSFGVFFDLDDARMLSNVRIERWLTGP